MKLEGKVAIVTGGARDLGRAISVKLAAGGRGADGRLFPELFRQ